MTDKPRIPRPEVFPPPLPGSLQGEPFPLAVDDPLHMTPVPESRRMRSTPPDGTPLPRRFAEQSQSSPLEDTIRDLRLTNLLLRERLTAVTSLTTPSPVPTVEPPKSKARAAAEVTGKVSLNLGKYGTHILGVLALADVVVGLWLPEYKGPLAAIKSALGIP